MEPFFDAILAAYRRGLSNQGGLWQGRVARYAKPGLLLVFLGMCGAGFIAFALYFYLRGADLEAPVPPIASSIVNVIALSPIVLFHLYFVLNFIALLGDRSNGSILPQDRKS